MIVANTQVTDCASRSSPAHINRKSLTPLARIDLPAGKPPEYGRAVAVAVHNAMIATLNAPKDDRFHVISEHTGHPAHRSDLSYLSWSRAKRGRADHQTHPQRGTDGRGKESLHIRRLRSEDVFISLVEVNKENWSFGNGVAQYES